MAEYVVNPGSLRTKITLQQPTSTADAGGAQVASWANVTTNPIIWARWVNAHGQEAVISEAIKNNQRAVVTIHYRSDVLPTWRVLRNGDPWQIISIDNVQDRNRWTELVVERVKGSI